MYKDGYMTAEEWAKVDPANLPTTEQWPETEQRIANAKPSLSRPLRLSVPTKTLPREERLARRKELQAFAEQRSKATPEEDFARLYRLLEIHEESKPYSQLSPQNSVFNRLANLRAFSSWPAIKSEFFTWRGWNRFRSEVITSRWAFGSANGSEYIRVPGGWYPIAKDHVGFALNYYTFWFVILAAVAYRENYKTVPAVKQWSKERYGGPVHYS